MISDLYTFRYSTAQILYYNICLERTMRVAFFKLWVELCGFTLMYDSILTHVTLVYLSENRLGVIIHKFGWSVDYSQNMFLCKFIQYTKLDT